MAKAVRWLSAIVSLDVAGYARLVEQDEIATLAALNKIRTRILEPSLSEFAGKTFKTMGDGALVEFRSAVDAIEWTIAFQNSVREFCGDLAADRAIKIRAGIALADVVVDETDRFGKGVNLAARVQQIAPPGGIAVTDHVFVHATGIMTADFRDAGEHRFKNFSDPVKIWLWTPADELVARVLPAMPAELPAVPGMEGSPSIVVLPFDDFSDDGSGKRLADAIVQEITATLSRVHDFMVVARNSAYAYTGGTADLSQVRRQLGVRYVLVGSLNRSGSKIRISAQLIDAENATHLWSDRFDGDVDDIFELQEKIANLVAGALLPSIRAAEIARARRKPPENLAAYDVLMRAMPHLWAHRRSENEIAVGLLEEALALDPDYAVAAALAAWAIAQQIVYNWTTDIEHYRQRGAALVERAGENVLDDPTGLTALGAAITLLYADKPRAVRLVERALKLDPNHAWAWTRRGFLHAYCNEPDAAIACFERAIRLSPIDPFAFNCYIGIGFAHFAAGRPLEGISWTQQALDQKPAIRWPYRDIAAFHGDAGDVASAKEALRLFRKAQPDATLALTAEALKFFDKPLLDRYLAGLRIAGLS